MHYGSSKENTLTSPNYLAVEPVPEQPLTIRANKIHVWDNYKIGRKIMSEFNFFESIGELTPGKNQNLC